MTAPLALLGDIGGPELLLVMFLILLLFGGEKLPQLARGLGKSVREFKKVTSEAQNEIKRAIDDAPEPTVPKAPTTPAPSGPAEPLPYEELKKP
jgi:sec-independent protein translocase protein TatA